MTNEQTQRFRMVIMITLRAIKAPTPMAMAIEMLRMIFLWWRFLGKKVGRVGVEDNGLGEDSG